MKHATEITKTWVCCKHITYIICKLTVLIVQYRQYNIVYLQKTLSNGKLQCTIISCTLDTLDSTEI